MSRELDFMYRGDAVHTVTDDTGAAWFLAVDVCRVLELRNTAQAVSRLASDERTLMPLPSGGSAYMVNEPGLYQLVLGSRKPGAAAFKRWITHDVLPAIRGTGGYGSGQLTGAALIEAALKEASATRKALAAGATVADAAAHVADTPGAVPCSTYLARTYRKAPTRSAWRRAVDHGLVTESHGCYTPTEQALRHGWLEYHEQTVVMWDATVTSCRRLFITPAGITRLKGGAA